MACRACFFEHPIVGAGATSGEKFNPIRTRQFNTTALDLVESLPAESQHVSNRQKCFRWLVTTTINPATPNLQAFAALPGWCKVFVLDRKSPRDFTLKGPGVVVLTVADQEALPYRLAKLTPWNHFGRKNVGYLYALLHGAELIYDTDDDNIIEVSKSQQSLLPTSLKVANLHLAPATELGAFNPYPFWGAERAWPRGFPLSLVNAVEAKFGAVPADEKALTGQRTCYLQSLANADPDMDAIYRLTQPLPIFFPVLGVQLVYPSGVYAPANAQAALMSSEVAAAMLLPVTVHGRVSDIWRSYIMQRVMWDSGCRLAFTDPWVRQYRNVHGYQKDFQAELDLYLKTEGMLKVLNEVSFDPNEVLGSRVLKTFIALYEHGLIEELDVKLAYAYLRDLSLIHGVPEYPSKMQQALVKPALVGVYRRAAICVTGIFRGGPFTLPLLRINVLEALGTPFDIFVSTPKEGDVDASDLLYFLPNMRGTVHPDYSKVPSLTLSSDWKKTALIEGTSHTPQKWVKQLTDLAGCKEAIRQSGQQYTHAVRVRADSLVMDRLPVPLAEVKKGTIVVPDNEDYRGVNDRFAYGNLEDMLVLFQMLDTLPQLLKEIKTEGMPELYWNAETMYKKYAEDRGLAFEKKPIQLCRFRSFEGSTLWMDGYDRGTFPACSKYCDNIRGCKSQ